MISLITPFKDFDALHELYVNAVKDAKRVQRFIDKEKSSAARDSTMNLPRAEIAKFSGDPLEFPVFMSSFDELVDAEISDNAKLT